MRESKGEGAATRPQLGNDGIRSDEALEKAHLIANGVYNYRVIALTQCLGKQSEVLVIKGAVELKTIWLGCIPQASRYRDLVLALIM
jgi:hypothetical protein